MALDFTFYMSQLLFTRALIKPSINQKWRPLTQTFLLHLNTGIKVFCEKNTHSLKCENVSQNAFVNVAPVYLMFQFWGEKLTHTVHSSSATNATPLYTY